MLIRLQLNNYTTYLNIIIIKLFKVLASIVIGANNNKVVNNSV